MKHIYYIGVYLIIQQYQKLCSLARALIHRHLLYGKNLEFVDSYKYLGVTVVAGKIFSTSHLKPLIKFQSAADTVLNVNREPSEQILMKMLYATCIPHLTYASDVVQYSTSQMHSMNVAVNDCINRVLLLIVGKVFVILANPLVIPLLVKHLKKDHLNFSTCSLSYGTLH